jgi:hypothetical protein
VDYRLAAPADRAAGPADGESRDWTSSYPPVVRRARVGLLPSRSGRVTMYAAASTGRPPITPSPEGAHADGLTAPSTRVPEAERPSLCL